LWNCSAISNVDHTIWSEALGRIDAWGNAATRTYNKEKTNQYERALANRKPNVKQPIPVQWVCPAMEDHYKGLSCIGGTQSLLICEGTFDRSTDLKWSISDLYRGITPRSLIEEWGEFFSTPSTITRKVIHKFVGYLENQATELIWKPRCTTTIARERELGITGKQKRASYSGPRGPWSDGYGYICQDGDCPCGSPLQDHIDGQCPGAVLDPHTADAKLIQCLKGMRRLATMEGMGRTPYF
jgi:hypothetical protein